MLRRKFARSRLGRNTSCSSHKKGQTELEMIADDEEHKKMSIEDAAVNVVSEVHHRTLRKRKTSEKESHSEGESSEDEAICEKSTDENLLTRSRKRPRSLRVSLTLPPSVETTPINSKVRPLNNSALKLSVSLLEETPMNIEKHIEASPKAPVQTSTQQEQTDHCGGISFNEQMDEQPESGDDKQPETQVEVKSQLPLVGPKGQLQPVPAPRDEDPASLKTTKEVDTPLTNHDGPSRDAISSPSTITVTSVSSSPTVPPVTTAIVRPSSLFTSSKDSLVKVSAGVTKLKPCKPKRPSIAVDTVLPNSCGTVALSPLEKLRYEIVASNRSVEMHQRSNKSAGSSAMTLMQSTGTIPSAPPIRSGTAPSHHSRKSSAPARAVTSLVGRVNEQKRIRPPSHSSTQKQNYIVISPSPSPPPPPPPLSLSSSGNSQSQLSHVTVKGPHPQFHQSQQSRRSDQVYSEVADMRSKV